MLSKTSCNPEMPRRCAAYFEIGLILMHTYGIDISMFTRDKNTVQTDEFLNATTIDFGWHKT